MRKITSLALSLILIVLPSMAFNQMTFADDPGPLPVQEPDYPPAPSTDGASGEPIYGPPAEQINPTPTGPIAPALTAEQLKANAAAGGYATKPSAPASAPTSTNSSPETSATAVPAAIATTTTHQTPVGAGTAPSKVTNRPNLATLNIKPANKNNIDIILIYGFIVLAALVGLSLRAKNTLSKRVSRK